MPVQLFFVNVPYNCSDRELNEWIASHGIEIVSLRIIRDLVSGVSPAFAYATLQENGEIEGAISALNGKKLRHQVLTVSKVTWRHAVA